jgi:hypothetical protein
MTWTKTARRPFAMDEELAIFPRDYVPFNLARIVRYIVKESEPGFGNYVGEGTSNEMSDDLPVCQSAIGGGAHCAKIVLAQF